MLFVEGSPLEGVYEKQAETIWTSLESMILDTIKVATICLINEGIGAEGMVFRTWAHHH